MQNSLQDTRDNGYGSSYTGIYLEYATAHDRKTW